MADYFAFGSGGLQEAVRQIFSKLKTLLDGKQAKLTEKQLQYYGVCSTAASAKEKTVTIPGISTLVDGLVINVKFTENQSYSGTPTLNVNSLGAVDIHYIAGSTAGMYEWNAGEILNLVYDGTAWVIQSHARASTAYWGIVQLYTSATSASGSQALTPAGLNNLWVNLISDYPIHSASSPYHVGDIVRRQYNLWTCNTDTGPNGEAWDDAKWDKMPTLLELISAKYTKPANGIPGSDLAAGVIPSVPSAYTSNPDMDGTASPGSSGSWARGDHVHPTDTGRQAKITASGILKGDGNGGVSAAASGTDYEAPVTKGTVTLSTTWTGAGPYTQTVTVSGATVTANSKVDIQPDSTALAQLIAGGVTALYIENNAGTLTATAIGAAPTAALTVQCTVTEVAV